MIEKYMKYIVREMKGEREIFFREREIDREKNK